MALVCVSDYEKKAAEVLASEFLTFYQDGAGDKITLRLNRTAFDKIRIRPRVLIDTSNRNLSCNILGINLDFPIAIAPSAYHKLACSDGENATALAAGKQNVIYTMATLSTVSIEEVAATAPQTNKWFQLYLLKDREIVKKLVRRAEENGYKAIVLTVDSQVLGTRYSGMRNKWTLPSNLHLANFVNDEDQTKDTEDDGIVQSTASMLDTTMNWNDVKWLTKFTRLPVILKGILTHEDATLALDCGCKAIIVSNHGARQLDTVPGTIEALPEIVKAVGSKLVVMLDGGIRNGTDVFKALALGAKCVLIGRPVIFGLAVNGQQGVEHILEILKKELDTTMALTGVKNLSEINRNHVAHESTYNLL